MKYTAPEGLRAISVGGQEFKVSHGVVDIPDDIVVDAEAIKAHGLTVAQSESEPEKKSTGKK